MVMILRKRRAPPPPPPPLSDLDSDSDPDYSKGSKTKPIKKKRVAMGRAQQQQQTSSGSESENENENEEVKEYERVREERIRENRERMEKLGIFNLSSNLFNGNGIPNRNRNRNRNVVVKKKRYPPLYPQSRKSDRLKNMPKAPYIETQGTLRDMGITMPDEWKPEIYTKEDEKLLGDCNEKWELKTDGFEEDGERVYDPFGTPCHQCRQKTMGKLTFCGKCRSAHGQFCGDCLFTRYGENVLEASSNPDWSCPVCRDICNCSRCRRTKGWQPINIPYSKIVSSNFKSVAHYLILTRRAGVKPKELENEVPTVDSKTEESAKPQQNEGSDYSAESSEYESDDSDSDDDSKGEKKKDQSVERQINSTEETNATDPAND